MFLVLFVQQWEVLMFYHVLYPCMISSVFHHKAELNVPLAGMDSE